MKRIFGLTVLFLLTLLPVAAQTETSLRLYDEAHKTDMETFLKRDFSAVDSTSMHDLAVLLYGDKDYASAGACWEIALTKVKKFGKAYEQILNAMFMAYYDLGDNDKLQHVLALAEEVNLNELQKECNDYKCKLERAQYFHLHDDEIKAKEYIAESLELCKTEVQRIEVEEKYAWMLFESRDYESCAQYYLSAARRLQTSSEDLVHVATDLYRAAQNYLLAGRYDLSEIYSREAADCCVFKNTDAEMEIYLMSLTLLGDALKCQRKYLEAFPIYQQALDGYASLMPGSEKHADVIADIAYVETRMKEYGKAKEHYKDALKIYKSNGLDDKYSNTYSSLMVCLRQSGDDAEADYMEAEAENRRDEVYRRILDSELASLETTRRYLSPSVYTNSLNTIAGAYFGVEEYEKSADFFALYSESLRNMLRERFLLMTANDRQRVWTEHQRQIDDFCYDISVLPASETHLLQKFTPTFFDLELLSKGLMLNSSIEFEKVLDLKNDKRLKDIYRQIKENQQEIERLQAVATDSNLQKVLSLKQSNAPLQKKLMEGCAEVSDYTKYLSYTWRDVQQKLNDDDVAIEFASVQMSPLDKDTYLLALVLHSTGEPVMEVVSTNAVLKNLADKEDLYDNASYFNLFWGFLQKHLIDKKRVFFAPNNMLSNIAVEYLTDGKNTFFESREVYRLSSTKELCREYKSAVNNKMFVFGAVDYSSQAVSKKRDVLSFGDLVHSRKEIEGICASMKKISKINLYDGTKATEYNFMKMSDQCPAIVHISSHGKYLGSSRTSPQEAMEKSILALAGANITGLPRDNDGYVSASDVAGMNLRGCELAVLSACETGVGGLEADGVFGLQRGFKNAGVHTLLMSLKPVYDESTSVLMIEFYKGLSEGMTKREALVWAQKRLRSQEKFKKGEFWAPFILLDALDI